MVSSPSTKVCKLDFKSLNEDFALTLDEGLQLELRQLLQGMNSFFGLYAFIDERAALKEAWEAFEMRRLQEHLRQMVPESMQLQLV